MVERTLNDPTFKAEMAAKEKAKQDAIEAEKKAKMVKEKVAKIKKDLMEHVIKDDIHNMQFLDNSVGLFYTNIFDHSIDPKKFLSEI